MRTLIRSCQNLSAEIQNVYDLATKKYFSYEGPSSIFEKNVSFRVHRLYLIMKNVWIEDFIIECLNLVYPLRLTKVLKDILWGFTTDINKHETAPQRF